MGGSGHWKLICEAGIHRFIVKISMFCILFVFLTLSKMPKISFDNLNLFDRGKSGLN